MTNFAYWHNVSQTVARARVTNSDLTDDGGEPRVTLWMSNDAGESTAALSLTRAHAAALATLLAQAAQGQAPDTEVWL